MLRKLFNKFILKRYDLEFLNHEKNEWVKYTGYSDLSDFEKSLDTIKYATRVFPWLRWRITCTDGTIIPAEILGL